MIRKNRTSKYHVLAVPIFMLVVMFSMCFPVGSHASRPVLPGETQKPVGPVPVTQKDIDERKALIEKNKGKSMEEMERIIKEHDRRRYEEYLKKLEAENAEKAEKANKIEIQEESNDEKKEVLHIEKKEDGHIIIRKKN